MTTIETNRGEEPGVQEAKAEIRIYNTLSRSKELLQRWWLGPSEFTCADLLFTTKHTSAIWWAGDF